jgi:MFS family permease
VNASDSSGPWLRTVTPRQWRTLAAAMLGWMLDATDIMLYAFALTAIQEEFGLSSAAAGSLASGTLVASAFGGAAAGYLADRYGRVRVLIFAILAYSVFTGLTATSRSVWELALWRALTGLGLGAEWSAGSVLVAETWPAEHRGKAIGFMQSGWALGYILAALLAAAILPTFGWRWLFLAGTVPAVLAWWVRRKVEEPEIWRRARRSPEQPAGFRAAIAAVFAPELRRRALLATALCATLLFAYWGLFTWMPAYLATPAERGGAGLGLAGSSAWIIPVQVGAFFGYTLFGVLADRYGRKPVFLAFVLGAAVLTPVYALAAHSLYTLLALGPLIGFFGHGYFSVFGAMLAELFPSGIRGTAQGLCYNSGRAISAAAPFSVGALADVYGVGPALAITAAFFLLAAVLMLALPETKGKALG